MIMALGIPLEYIIGEETLAFPISIWLCKMMVILFFTIIMTISFGPLLDTMDRHVQGAVKRVIM